MQPQGDLAVCAACGASEPARRLPLFVVTGASGSGKTTVYPYLVTALKECLVFDVDWLIDSFQMASTLEAVNWTAFRDAWLTTAHGVAQSGRHTVLLGPFTPEQLADLPARRWVTDIHFAVLDCNDDERRQRLERRPPWRERTVERQIAFGAHLRKIIPTVIETDQGPSEAADQLATWLYGLLPNYK